MDGSGRSDHRRRVVVAVDVAKEDFVATLLTADQEAQVTFGWRHPGGTAEVVEQLVELGAGRRLEAYGDPASVAADAERAEALLRRTGRSRLRAEKIGAVLASARRSLGVPCLAAERELLQWLAGDRLAARREVRRIERMLAGQVKQEPVLVRMAGVVGTVSAAVLVAAVGSPQSDPTASSYLKALGLNLKERSSGKHKGQLRITKRGPSLARFYLYFATLRLIAHEPVVKRWYQLKTSRPGALKNKVVIALMRKLAQAVWQIAHGSRFEVNKLFDREAVAET